MVNVLIVDDSALMRRNLKLIFTKAGHKVVAEASDGNSAFYEYIQHKPDLVTMDITMPSLSGVDALKKILQHDPEAKIIMVSALDQRPMILDALQSGAKHYILKPITEEKVLSVIKQVLEPAEEEGEEKAHQ